MNEQASEINQWQLFLSSTGAVHYKSSFSRGPLYYSPQISQLTGLSPDYFINNAAKWTALVHPNEMEYFLSRNNATPCTPLNYRIKSKGGNWRLVQDRVLQSWNDAGDTIIEGILIPSVESLSKERTGAEDLYQEMTEGIPGAIFQYILHSDNSDQIAYMSTSSILIWELSPDELTKDPSPLWAMILPEDVEGLRRSIQDSAKSMSYWAHEWRIKTPSGKVKRLSGSGSPKHGIGGDIVWNSVIIDVTEERQRQQALDSFFEQRFSLNAIVDLDGRFLQLNQLWESTLGYTREELEGQRLIDFVHPDDREATAMEMAEIAEGAADSNHFVNRYRRKDGSYRYLSWTSNTSSSEKRIYAAAVDITEGLEAEEKLKQAAAVFENTADGVLITDMDKIIVEVNQAFTTITGFEQQDAIGHHISILQSEKHDAVFYDALWHAVRETGNWHGEIWNKRKDGSHYPELLTISTIKDGEFATGYVAVFSDITALKQHQKKLAHMAHHDALTDLPNRVLFNMRLAQSLRLASRSGTVLAVIFIDLDRFKLINDSMGHAAGDSLLIDVAHRLRSALRQSDTVARISGDEFVILLENIDGPQQAGHVAETLIQAFQLPFTIHESEVSITASMGISLYPQDSADLEALVANADAAMYKAKESGKNRYVFYTAEFTRQAVEFVFVENALKKALSEEQFFLLFQPQYPNDGSRIVGMEVLIRWQHPDEGMIAPGVFIPVAEQSGLISAIGEWVLTKACLQARVWLDEGLDIGRIAVNVSATQFYNKQFTDKIITVLEETGLPATHLELEVTESFLMHHVETAISTLEVLRGKGISVAIDDFGTGYSSLSYLKKFSVDKLKIDQSFIRDIPEDEDDKAIADSIIGLGNTLKLTVIAEGVETRSQREFLEGKRCNIQGFLFGRPVSASDMSVMLQENEATLPRV